MPHVVSTVSPVTHQKPTYGSLPFIHHVFLINVSKVHFCVHLIQPYPHSAWVPQGPFYLGSMKMYYPKLLATEGLSLDFLNWRQLPEENCSFCPGSPHDFLLAEPQPKSVVNQTHAGLGYLMIPTQVHWAQLWGNGKWRGALLETIWMWFAETLEVWEGCGLQNRCWMPL